MKILIIGASKSGKAAAHLAKSLGNEVFVTENQLKDKFQFTINEFDAQNISYEFGHNSLDKVDWADLIISSPGVPRDAEIIKKAEVKGIEIISEIEYSYRNCNNPIIAVTGTNGKTTTTALIEFILNSSGKNAIAAGNIGLPFAEVIKMINEGTNSLNEKSIIVLEVSSYQLDRIVRFRPNVAIITNITPDHLKYHGTMGDYVETKWKICANQNADDLLILNIDDEYLSQNRKINSKIEYFSLQTQTGGTFVQNDEIILINKEHKEEGLMLVQHLSLPGRHNVYNSLAAILATRAFEVSNENLRDALKKFEGVNHRLELIRSINEVKFINDSKATNVNSTWYALNSYDSPIIWIAGGRGDNNDYSQLDESVRRNVKKIICIGEEKEVIAQHFCAIKDCVQFETLEEAIFDAQLSANEGEVVLFSPSCKSFDMFLNFEQRGEEFAKIVNKLTSG
ncbi:MAG: UDP-N-acetylmuramoylalanine--D-glutamate ligase [Ignavibacteria bacterium GWF2_33_9]|nr:MAG: UDP-N-acetylmuramoylalanine--D-glutamate ligase [Ignavibacteria bacterium GWF2_33_9]